MSYYILGTVVKLIVLKKKILVEMLSITMCVNCLHTRLGTCILSFYGFITDFPRDSDSGISMCQFDMSF